jgi:hypothetical protein
MAKKPAAAHADNLPPAMDYGMHEATYRGFISFIKWCIISLALVVVSLYAFIEAGNAIIGTLLLLLIPVLIFGVLVLGQRRT